MEKEIENPCQGSQQNIELDTRRVGIYVHNYPVSLASPVDRRRTAMYSDSTSESTSLGVKPEKEEAKEVVLCKGFLHSKL